MTANNPLQKYFRQPKIYMALPSKGLFYPPGSLLGDYNNVPIFGMNMKTVTFMVCSLMTIST